MRTFCSSYADAAFRGSPMTSVLVTIGVQRVNVYPPTFLGYVVRWKYCVKLTGVKTLKGKQSRYEDVGRDKVAYFFWQGKDSTLNEKGTAALMTVELDSDKGPQVIKPQLYVFSTVLMHFVLFY